MQLNILAPLTSENCNPQRTPIVDYNTDNDTNKKIKISIQEGAIATVQDTKEKLVLCRIQNEQFF
jgi:hypothetical protein